MLYIKSAHDLAAKRMPAWPPSHRDAGQSLTAVAVLSKPPCTKSSSSTWRPTSRSPGRMTGTGSACRPTWNGNFVVTSSAAFSPTALPAPAARTVGMIFSLRSRARGAGCARRATPGGWLRPRRIWSITSSRRLRRGPAHHRLHHRCRPGAGHPGTHRRARHPAQDRVCQGTARMVRRLCGGRHRRRGVPVGRSPLLAGVRVRPTGILVAARRGAAGPVVAARA